MTVGRDHQGCWKMRQSHLQRQGGKRGREGARERKHGFSRVFQPDRFSREIYLTHGWRIRTSTFTNRAVFWFFHRFCFREVHSPSCLTNPAALPRCPVESPVEGRFKLDDVEYQLETNNGLGLKIRMVKIIIFPYSKAPYILAHYRL